MATEFTLHVWGPAFGLPSIDVECLATLTYLRQHVPRNALTRWSIIASNDPSVSPSHILPALHHEGVWITGHNAIVRHISPDLPPPPPSATAFSTYLSSHATALIDLTLYVSMANWTTIARPAYSSLLPWPLTWMLPSRLRRAALHRAERLGFSDLDTEAEVYRNNEKPVAKVPSSFDWRLPGSTRRSVVGSMSPEQAAGIRLVAFARDVLGVIRDNMALFEKDEQLSGEGCFAFGIIWLLTVPDVPQHWLADLIKSEFPELIKSTNAILPVPVPITQATRSFSNTLAQSLHLVIQEIPWLGNWYLQEWREMVRRDPADGAPRWPGGMAAGIVMTVSVAMGVYAVGRVWQPVGMAVYLWSPRGVSKMGQMGEVGAMLGMAMGGMGMGYRGMGERRRMVEDVNISL